jgi:hypothetical protein
VLAANALGQVNSNHAINGSGGRISWLPAILSSGWLVGLLVALTEVSNR